MEKVGFAAVTLLLQLVLDAPAAGVPICVYGQAGCHHHHHHQHQHHHHHHHPSLADLFDRVIQQSSRMHWISSDLHNEFEQYFFPSKNLIGKSKCHTYDIATPDDKENAQRLGQEQLTAVILRLLAAWGDPLSQLHRSMSEDRSEESNLYSSSKALEMSDMVQELRDGVVKMAEKMRLLGMLSGADGEVPGEALVPSSAFSFYERGELNSADHGDLLYCFRRDSNKVRNYLRILKCSALPGLDC